MQKIISLFQRDRGFSLVWDRVTPGAEWVLAGEGVPTRKFDGTACLVRGGRLYKRHELRDMYIDHMVDDHAVWACRNDVPEDFEPATEVDPVTCKVQGWLPVGGGPEDRYHMEAFQARQSYGGSVDGTYELCGPKINDNPERCGSHVLLVHGKHALILGLPRSFESIKLFLSQHDVEGIVFHHPDGRKVKIKGCDFGLTRPKKEPLPTR